MSKFSAAIKRVESEILHVDTRSTSSKKSSKSRKVGKKIEKEIEKMKLDVGSVKSEIGVRHWFICIDQSESRNIDQSE